MGTLKEDLQTLLLDFNEEIDRELTLNDIDFLVEYSRIKLYQMAEVREENMSEFLFLDDLTQIWHSEIPIKSWIKAAGPYTLGTIS